MVIKKIFFVLFGVILMLSCSDDDSYEYHYELLPIEDALVPEEFIYGEVYDISVKYIVPNDYYVNSDILYEYDLEARNVAVISLVIESNDFETIDIEQELTFKVHALQESSYLFRFWQGDDDNGDPIYLTKEVPVINLSEEKANEFKETHIKM